VAHPKYWKEIEALARKIDAPAYVPPDTPQKQKRRLAARDEARARIFAKSSD
jgi:hypothetical protein